jgi:hypothetical protein
MRTKSITLLYQVTQKEIFPPAAKDLARKENWLEEVKHSVEADYKPLLVKVHYEIFNPEVDQLRAFFHVCVLYYCMQNLELTDREPTNEELRDYRSDLLDEMLGYDVKTARRVIRERKSTADLKTTTAWLKLLNELEETLFFDAGYEFPDSKEFWENVKKYGHARTKAMAIEHLQAVIKRRK